MLIKADNSFVGMSLIGFNLNNQDNHIIMEYTPKGFKLGLIISIISLVGTIYIVYKENYEKSQ